MWGRGRDEVMGLGLCLGLGLGLEGVADGLG